MSGVTVESHQAERRSHSSDLTVYDMYSWICMYSTGCFLVSKVTTDGLLWQIYL